MTVTTVGYGDYTPVTVYGRVTACFVMGIGLLTLAVVTAQVASSFVTQGAGRAQPGPQAGTAPEVTLAELDRRLARIEELLTAATASSSPRRPVHLSGTQAATRPDPLRDRRPVTCSGGRSRSSRALGGAARHLSPQGSGRILADSISLLQTPAVAEPTEVGLS